MDFVLFISSKYSETTGKKGNFKYSTEKKGKLHSIKWKTCSRKGN